MCADICKRLGRAGRKPPVTFLLTIWLALHMQLIQCIVCTAGDPTDCVLAANHRERIDANTVTGDNMDSLRSQVWKGEVLDINFANAATSCNAVLSS